MVLHNSNYNQQHLLLGRSILLIRRITPYPSFKARYNTTTTTTTTTNNNNNKKKKCANVTVKVARIMLQ
jgi:hypothetical protein